MNMVNDVRAAVRFFVNRRKARKEPIKPAKQSEPCVSFYDTVEGCVIWNLTPDICKAAAGAFRALPYEAKHRLTFSLKNGEYCDRARFWSAVLRPVLSQDQHSAAMIAILRRYRDIKAMRRRC